MIPWVGFPPLPAQFEYETEVHQSIDQEHSLFFNIFRKKNVPLNRGLLIIHGQGEHGGRYQHFPHYLKDKYDVIIAPDLRGHGRSEGVRGHVERFDEYVDDVLLAWELLQKKLTGGGNIVHDLFGHSMGGLVALRTLHYRPELPASHVFISSPALGLKVEVPLIKDLAARILSKVWGELQMDTGLDASKLSHDRNVVDAYLKDRLNHSKATPKFYLSFLDAMKETMVSDLHFNSSAKILFQLAAEDEIVNTATAKLFFEQLKHEHKKMIVYPGLYHEIFNETIKEHVFEDLVKEITP